MLIDIDPYVQLVVLVLGGFSFRVHCGTVMGPAEAAVLLLFAEPSQTVPQYTVVPS